MKISAKRMAVLREHIRSESKHDMEALLAGMTSDCFNDVVGCRSHLWDRSKLLSDIVNIGKVSPILPCEFVAFSAPTKTVS